MIVYTYPSQESTLEYNSNQEENSKKLVTKLYQTSTITWTTDAPANKAQSEKLEKLKLQHVIERYETPVTATSNTQEKPAVPAPEHNNEEEYYYDYDAAEDHHEKLNLEEMEKDLERKEKNSSNFDKNQPEVDVKRSAEAIQNKTTIDVNDELKPASSTTPTPVERNNYTNFTDKNNSNSTNTTAATEARENATSTTNTSDNKIKNTTTQTSISNFTTQLPQVPSTPKIVKNTIAGEMTPSHAGTDVKQGGNGEPHKIPYTLENVNKPDELRREESEHRTRKSKGLSADYKVNHYINYSSDSKNLLTRSAATTVNEYDSEESNISSEALSVQVSFSCRFHFSCLF